MLTLTEAGGTFLLKNKLMSALSKVARLKDFSFFALTALLHR